MFFDWFETLAIECDAPDYAIVQACRKLGFQSPEDVRWRQADQATPKSERQAWWSFGSLKSPFGKSEPKSAGCVCSAEIPKLDGYRFTLTSGKETELLLGQCRRCRTMFWKEA